LGFLKGVGIQRGGNKTNLKAWDFGFQFKIRKNYIKRGGKNNHIK
jgi:hypothetical protein